MRSHTGIAMTRRHHALVLLMLVACASSCEQARARKFYQERECMDTVVGVTVFDTSAGHARRAIEAAFARIDEVVALADRYRPNSEVSKLIASGGPMRVSPEVYDLLKTAKDMAERTGGAFDITCGPLLIMWKQCGRAKRLPTKEELKRALAPVGSDGIVLADGTAKLAKPGMKIDLGGVAKGYAVDAAIAALRRAGITSALVNAGGDMAMIGPRPGKPNWSIGVQDPRKPDDQKAMVCTLALPPCAVATSGNYQRYVEIEGRRFSHIVDPRTGWPCASVPSVTIVSKSSAMAADAWATAASVLPPDETLKLINADSDLEALLVTIQDDGELGLAMSKGFAALVKQWLAARPK